MTDGFVTDDDLLLEDKQLNGLYWGKVVRTDDPDQMGCVTCRVEGITQKETTWAFPIGVPGSSVDGKGGFYVPRSGSMVLVGFIYGKLEQPYYITAHRPLNTTIPTIAKAQKKTDMTKVHVVTETDTFEVFILDTDTEKKIVLRTLDKQNVIELDAKDGSILLQGERFVIIKAPTVDITGANVQIKGRPVSCTGLSL